ncbi:phage scaffolding protein [Clostridium novyi]|uniref:Phage scaffold protein n=1 Tax=Clostridium novyi B str. ATCC 27606 TaxID=1443123 RepID=A0AA40M4E0_CLONO|nr:phage scaffolding protein [Clostridium novyi]KEI08158.1 phage scaffold protein [Clostridium novyi B str. NCTC 9691]KEI11497.1 phage scaffold protein [Clostridium novyi B str. ATCC 27606]
MPKLNEILGEESFKQLPEELRKKYKDIDLVDSSNYVEKKELETANEAIKQYKKDIKKRDKDLEDLQGKIKDNEELNIEIENLKAANKKASEDYEAKLNQISFDTKFEKAIAGYKAKNPKALRALLDMEKVKLVDDTFIGLEEQVNTLKESDAYLFEAEQTGGTGNIAGGSSSMIDSEDEKLSIGARLAKERTEATKVAEAQNKFFS